jgi:hypothetical protein
VSGIVALGSPQMDPFAVNPLVRASIFGLGIAGTLGARGFFRHTCLWGECCNGFWDEFEEPFPRGVGYLSVYSRTDGIVDWRSCLDPAARHHEISASHLGMAVNANAYRAVADALARYRRSGARRGARRSSGGKVVPITRAA